MKVCVDGEVKDIVLGMKFDCYKVYDIEIVVDCIVVKDFDCKCLYDFIVMVMCFGFKYMMV